MNLAAINVNGPRALEPRVTQFNLPFWSGLAEGEFRCTACEDCGHLSFPPKSICPLCQSNSITWQALNGRGQVYSVSTIHAVAPALAADGPLRVAIVDLDEQVRLVVRLLDDSQACTIGDRVELVVTKHSDDQLFFAARKILPENPNA